MTVLAAVADRAREESGDGLISTFFGVLMFLLFLLLSVQVSVHLHASTVVASAAFDAARLASAAPAGAVGCGPPDAIAMDRADRHLTELLGGLAEGAETSWQGTGAQEVVLRVAVTSPARLVGGTGTVTGLDRIERTVRLRRECAA